MFISVLIQTVETLQLSVQRLTLGMSILQVHENSGNNRNLKEQCREKITCTPAMKEGQTIWVGQFVLSKKTRKTILSGQPGHEKSINMCMDNIFCFLVLINTAKYSAIKRPKMSANQI